MASCKAEVEKLAKNPEGVTKVSFSDGCNNKKTGC